MTNLRNTDSTHAMHSLSTTWSNDSTSELVGLPWTGWEVQDR